MTTTPTGRIVADKPSIQDLRWGKVAAKAPIFGGDYSSAECRIMRNMFAQQNKDYTPGTWGKLEDGSTKFIARRQIAHRSTQIYLVTIVAGVARHYMITEKCSWKRAGNATPTPEELEAWKAAYGE